MNDTTVVEPPATAEVPKRELIRIRVPRWDPDRFKELDRGGEATIYWLKPDLVAKVFHPPSAPEFVDFPTFKEAARVRLEEMQSKLPVFPTNAPESVVAPTGLLVTPRDLIFGYTMSFVEGTVLGKQAKKNAFFPPSRIRQIILKLYDELEKVHTSGIVIGDLNENNIMLSGGEPRFIDADSMQYAGFVCKAFTPRFTDPDLLRIVRNRSTKLDEYSLIKQHTELTDWYSFLVVAMRLLVLTDPYGGVVKGMDLAERIKKRVTIFDFASVQYPKMARPLAGVPRPLMEVFWEVFQNGKRIKPPREVFEELPKPTARKAAKVATSSTRSKENGKSSK